MIRKEKGFTLLEMLLVLAVLSILISFTVPNLSELKKIHEQNNFLTVLEADIYNLQIKSLRTVGSRRLYFRDDHYIIIENMAITKRRNYPDQFVIKSNKGVPIQFRSNGEIEQPITYMFDLREERYKLVFPFGKGRHYIEKI